MTTLETKVPNDNLWQYHEPRTPEEPGSISRVILLVEDEIHLQFFIWKLLKSEGSKVLTASSGEAALEVSRNYRGKIDLLVTDIQMAGMTGLDLCKALSAERPGLHFLTMSGEAGWKDQASLAGLPFLQKPFGPAALRDAMQAATAPVPAA